MSKKKKTRRREIQKMLSAPAAPRQVVPGTTLARSVEMQAQSNARTWQGWKNSPDPAERETFRQVSADPRYARYERGTW